MMSPHVFVTSITLTFFSLPILGQELQDIYESQLQKEFYASDVNLTFANRLATRGVYQGFAHFFYESAEEQREHGKKLLDFYNVRNRPLSFQKIQIDDDLAKMSNLSEMIKKAKDLEEDVCDNLIAVRQSAHEKRDYPTVHFIEEEMLKEKTTALKYMNDFVQRLQRNEKNSTIVLQMMDQDLRKKQPKKP